jgi:uncharacterized membrane protein (UPF0127 family)
LRKTYCVYNQTRESFLSLSVERADTSVSRLKGLLGRMRMRSDEGLWLLPSQGVHTFGLLFHIDVIYLDSEHQVTHLVEHLRPFRASSIRLNSASVLQLPPHTIFASDTRIGDQMLISLPEEIGIDLEKIKNQPSRRGHVQAMNGRGKDR